MPIYEYQCTACEHKLEALQKFSDEPLLECPECDKPDLKKLISAASFRLKGGGWYETDFKTGNKKQLAETDSGKSSTESSATKQASSADKPSKPKQDAPKPSQKTNSSKAAS